jgi:peroxiredoxin
VVLADDEVQAAFGGTEYIPTTFIIDRDGNIREKKVGAVPVDVYETALLKYLK